MLRLNPRVAAAQLQLSRLQLAHGAAAEAVQLAESALKNAPGSAEAKLTLAGRLSPSAISRVPSRWSRSC